MKIIQILGLIFPLLYIGCGESEKITSPKLVEQRKSDENVTIMPSDKILLEALGFDVQNQKISIDINKTTNFFKRMEIEMHGKADEIQSKIKQADINLSRDIGISFDSEKIGIDLNKTKNMFQEINILLKEVLLDKNSSKY